MEEIRVIETERQIRAHYERIAQRWRVLVRKAIILGEFNARFKKKDPTG